MLKKIASIVIISVLCMGVSFAQEEIVQEPEVVVNKDALIREIVEMTTAEGIEREVTTMFTRQAKKTYMQVMLDAGMFGGAEGADLTNKITESENRFSQRFKDLYAQHVDVDELIVQIYYPVYDNAFTGEELLDIVSFYRTPSGRKLMLITPQLAQQSMERYNAMLYPQIEKIVTDIIDEEKAALSQVLAPPQQMPPQEPVPSEEAAKPVVVQ
jgi:hypothetical protein